MTNGVIDAEVIRRILKEQKEDYYMSIQTEDAISRQAVIDRLSHWYSDMLETNKEQEDLIEVIKAIPSAEPKTGHWIIVQGMNEQCSNCKKFFPLLDFKCRPFEIKYCPNCGAKMEG